MMAKRIFIAEAKKTAIGNFNGKLSDLSAVGIGFHS
jgi:hypothetical protein